MGGFRVSVTSTASALATLIARTSLALSKPYVAPNNEVEALAATTFAEVFNLDKAGIDDEFFELGGDSLLAEVLSLALSERTGLEFDPSLFVELGSPREVARLLEPKTIAPGWLDVAQYAQSARANMSILNAWRTVLRHLPATHAGAFNDDAQKDVQIVPAPEGEAPAILVFCGHGQRFAIPLNLVHRWVGRLGAHVIYLRDFSKLYYLAGVTSFGPDYAASIDALNRLIRDLGARSVHCMGNSAGVFGALQMGLDLGAESVLCLAGMTSVTPSKIQEAREKSKRKRVAIDPAMLDASSRFASASAHPRVRIIYGNDNEEDRREAERLAGLDGVELLPLTNWRHHLVIDALIESGEFEANLNWMLAAEDV